MTEILIFYNGKYFGQDLLFNSSETVNDLLSAIEHAKYVVSCRFGCSAENIEILVTSDKFKIATVEVFNGGRYGKPEIFKALIEPSYFNNGKMKKTDFTIVKRLETIKKGYNFNNIARNSMRIGDIEDVQNLLL